MQQTFSIGPDGHLTTGHATTDRYWINVEQPTMTEINQLAQKFNLPRTYLTAVLDDAEVSRTDQLDQPKTRQPGLIIMQFPKLVTSDLGYLEYQVYPMALILTKDVVFTVSNYPASFIQDFVMDPTTSRLSLTDHENFVLAIMWYIAHAYVLALNHINHQTDILERHLTRATRNTEIFRIMAYQKSLIHFNAALSQNAPVLKAVAASATRFTATDHQQLTTDILIETQQAADMTKTTNQILQQYSQMVSAVISNNLNDVMKVLTSLTIILTIPTIIGGIYGMNVHLPGAGLVHAFSWLMLATLLLCIISIEYLRNHDYF